MEDQGRNPATAARDYRTRYRELAMGRLCHPYRWSFETDWGTVTVEALEPDVALIKARLEWKGVGIGAMLCVRGRGGVWDLGGQIGSFGVTAMAAAVSP